MRDYREQHYPPITEERNQENIDMFFQFFYDRHEIWRKRFINKLPKEQWTDDPILKVTKYTNVYRELDRGTLWYLKYILQPFLDNNNTMGSHVDGKELDDNFKQWIWRTVLYRLCNRIETFEEVGLPNHLTYDSSMLHNDFWKSLDAISQRGLAVNTSAHLSCPTPAGYTKVEGYIMAINDLHGKLDYLCKDILRCKSSSEIFEAFKMIHCVGDFISYECVTDLMYAKYLGINGKPFVEDDWANVGPGAKEGIRMLFPSTKGKKAIYERMLELRDEQETHFKSLGIKFNFYEKFTKGHLSLRSCEHQLCEFQKFWLQKRGLGKQRMIFHKDGNRVVPHVDGDYKVIVDPNTGSDVIKVKV